LPFTSSATLFKKIHSDGTAVVNLISQNYQFLFLYDEHRFGKTGRSGYGQIWDFCASQLVTRQVSIFPPLSLLYFLSNKHNLCDLPLSDLMLPSVIVPAASTFRKTVMMAIQKLKQNIPGTASSLMSHSWQRSVIPVVGWVSSFLKAAKIRKGEKLGVPENKVSHCLMTLVTISAV
jgi:hypothetical protein